MDYRCWVETWGETDEENGKVLTALDAEDAAERHAEERMADDHQLNGIIVAVRAVELTVVARFKVTVEYDPTFSARLLP